MILFHKNDPDIFTSREISQFLNNYTFIFQGTTNENWP